MIFLREEIVYMRQNSFGLHGVACNCTCSICTHDLDTTSSNVSYHAYKSTTALCEFVLCPKLSKVAFHKYNCLLGSCADCGTKKLSLCLAKLATKKDLQVSAKVFEDVKIMVDANDVISSNQKERIKKTKDLLYKKLPCNELLHMFHTHLQKFIHHNFIYRWQAEQFKESLHNNSWPIQLFPSLTLPRVTL